MTVADALPRLPARRRARPDPGEAQAAEGESTLATDRGRIERHIIPLLGTMAVAVVQPADVRKFMHAVQHGKTKATIKTKPKGVARVTGGPALRHAQLACWAGSSPTPFEGLRADNPVHGIERPADQVRNAFLSMDDYGTLGAALGLPGCRARTAPPSLIRLLALTGCRKGEVIDLTRREVDLEHANSACRNKGGLQLAALGQAGRRSAGAACRATGKVRPCSAPARVASPIRGCPRPGSAS